MNGTGVGLGEGNCTVIRAVQRAWDGTGETGDGNGQRVWGRVAGEGVGGGGQRKDHRWWGMCRIMGTYTRRGGGYLETDLVWVV